MAKKKFTIERPQIDAAAIRSEIRKGAEDSKKLLEAKRDAERNAPPGTQAPDFWGWMDDPDIGNPFENWQYPGDLEQGTADEVSTISDALRRIIEEKQERRKKFALLVDNEYFLTVVFQCQQQRDEFVRQMGWERVDGNMFANSMFNGLELAALHDIKLELVYLPTKEPPQAPKDLRDHPIIGE